MSGKNDLLSIVDPNNLKEGRLVCVFLCVFSFSLNLVALNQILAERTH